MAGLTIAHLPKVAPETPAHGNKKAPACTQTRAGIEAKLSLLATSRHKTHAAENKKRERTGFGHRQHIIPRITKSDFINRACRGAIEHEIDDAAESCEPEVKTCH